MKLSQWHDGNVEPVHIGIYETSSHKFDGYFSYWDGKKFNGMWGSRSTAEIKSDFGSCSIPTRWRGIVKDKK
jgi:hypothetical protein